MLVCPIAETKDDVLDALQLVFTVRELETLVGEVLAERDSVVGWLALTIRGHDEESAAVLRKLVELFEVVLLGIADKGSKTKLLLSLLGKTDSILFRGTGL